MRTDRRSTSCRTRCHAVLFMVLTRLPRYGKTQVGSLPRGVWTIDQAASFRTTTCARLDLNASGGITNTLRPTSRTTTSQLHSSPQTLLSRRPVLTAKSTIRQRRPGNFAKSRSYSSQVIDRSVNQSGTNSFSSSMLSLEIERKLGTPIFRRNDITDRRRIAIFVLQDRQHSILNPHPQRSSWRRVSCPVVDFASHR